MKKWISCLVGIFHFFPLGKIIGCNRIKKKELKKIDTLGLLPFNGYHSYNKCNLQNLKGGMFRTNISNNHDQIYFLVIEDEI